MNNKGIALILSYAVIMILTMLGAIFLSRSAVEGKLVTRHSESIHAFWIAEAGLSRAFTDLAGGQTPPSGLVNFGGTLPTDGYQISVSGPSGGTQTITSTGTYGPTHTQREVSAKFYRIHPVFQNTISVGGDLKITGQTETHVNVYDQTRIYGDYSTECYSGSCPNPSNLYFEDKIAGEGSGNPPLSETTITVPDYDNNGTPDQFTDFVAFGNMAVSSYSPSEVMNIETEDSVTLWPWDVPSGIKIIYVHGNNPGTGDVTLMFSSSILGEDDLTIISTGDITYHQPLGGSVGDTRDSMACWGDYYEDGVGFAGSHKSVVYAHGDVEDNRTPWIFGGTTSSEGNYIANGDMNINVYVAWGQPSITRNYNYSDRSANGDLPPGFMYLSGSTGTPKLTEWKEQEVTP